MFYPIPLLPATAGPPPLSRATQVRESPQLGVHVSGLSRHATKTSADCETMIENGTGNRTVAATKYNSESSRSHAVFELHIQQKYFDKVPWIISNGHG